MSFSIRLTAEEKSLPESYAKLHSLSLGEAFKNALFERIEDEYDIAVDHEAYNDYVKDGCKSRPVSKLWEELEICQVGQIYSEEAERLDRKESYLGV